MTALAAAAAAALVGTAAGAAVGSEAAGDLEAALGEVAAQRVLAAGAATSGEPTLCYASLLYSDTFLLGVRVLGQSLRERTSRHHPKIALVADNVSERAAGVLRNDGWRVVRTSLVGNPNPSGSYPARFFGMYTKLATFGLHSQGCDRVMYLDGDTLAVNKGPDEALEQCPGFCANLKHSDRFNGGVEVLTPSSETHRRVMDAIKTVHSYTGGDQGMINGVFSAMPDAPLIGGEQMRALSAKHALPTQHGQQLARLPAGYNADVGLYILPGNRWAHEGGAAAVRVLHFTLGPLKPWDWWAGWISPPFATLGWREARARLPPEPPAHGLVGAALAGGRGEGAYLLLLAAVPLLLLAWATRRWLAVSYAAAAGRGGGARSMWVMWAAKLAEGDTRVCIAGARTAAGVGGSESSGAGASPSAPSAASVLAHSPSQHALPVWLPAASIGGVLACVGVAIGAPALLIPSTTIPWRAWVLVYIWFLCVGGVLLHSALQLLRATGTRAGRKRRAQRMQHGAGQQASTTATPATRRSTTPVLPSPQPLGDALVLFATVGTCATLAPWTSTFLGIKTMIPNIVGLVVGGVATLFALVLVAPPAGIAWYSSGYWAGLLGTTDMTAPLGTCTSPSLSPGKRAPAEGSAWKV